MIWLCRWIITVAPLWAAAAVALELSVPQVASFQGQDLNAFVDLQDLRGSAARLRVQHGSADEYQQLQIPRYSVAQQLSLAIVDAPLGGKRLTIRSNRPIVEPMVQLVVRFSDDQAQHLRALSLVVPAPLVGAQVAAALQNRDDRRTQLTQPKDTLWSIASDSRESSAVTVQQQMLAIVRLNPEAFIAENVNGLKSGYLLQLPDLFEASLLTASTALREVKQQYKSWVDEGFGLLPGQSNGDDSRSLRIVATQPSAVSPAASQRLSLESAAEGSATVGRELSSFDPTTTNSGVRDGTATQQMGVAEVAALELAADSGNNTINEAVANDRVSDTDEPAAPSTVVQQRPRDLPLPSSAVVAAAETASAEDSQPAQSDAPVVATKAQDDSLSPGLVGVIATILLTLIVIFMAWRRRRNAVTALQTTQQSAVEATINDSAETEFKEPTVAGAAAMQDTVAKDAATNDSGASRQEPLLVSPSGLPSMASDVDEEDIIETRIKLAVAFLEVGDKAGARELLLEVLEEGDEEQQTSARLLLEELDDSQ